ncbi:MAG: DUF3179 domain-containing protein [Halobacteriales archaeon]
MKRRDLLATIGTGILGGFAGCQGIAGHVCGDRTRAQTSDRAGTAASDSRTVAPESLPVPESDLVRSAPRDAIPAITAPKFAPNYTDLELEGYWWGTGESFTYTLELIDDDPVIGVEREGTARAYPLKVLVWHEVVNDDFGGPILVTYCPLCGSGIVAERRVDGEPTDFGVSGLLWKDNLVMYDERTESLWNQLSATAIRGVKTGTELSIQPSTFTSFGDWRTDYPDTTVLLPAPISGTIVSIRAPPYPRDPYERYYNSTEVGDDRSDFADDRLHPKTIVLGVEIDGEAIAYPPSAIGENGVINDTVGSVPIVVTTNRAGEPVAYDRRIDGRSYEFDRTDDDHLKAADTKWDPSTGQGMSGQYADIRLTPITSTKRLFWFAWLEFNPGSELYTDDDDQGLFGVGCRLL